jgi:CubicO group peptidase (beta-lactamase class C family)
MGRKCCWFVRMARSPVTLSLCKNWIFLLSGVFAATLPSIIPPASATTWSAAAPGKLTDAEIVRDIRSDSTRLASENEFSGAILIAKGDKILFEHAYGYADHAFVARNTVHTKFNLGSMEKMFTAVSILQLAERGKLSLNDKLIKLLPDYPDRDVASSITIYQLLTHTSGLGDMFNENYFDTPKDRLDTIAAYLPLFAGKPLLFKPGTRWSYSNAGYIVLGLVIERVSGESYYAYVRQHVFARAGMRDTDNYELHDDVPNLAIGYTYVGVKGRGPRITNVDFLARGTSAGGGYSTVGDLFRFARALEEYKLLNEKYTHLEMKGRVKSSIYGDTAIKYGFGMTEELVNGVRILGHSGGAPGISSNLDMYRDLGYTVVVMSNFDGGARMVNERLRLELTGAGLPRAVPLPRAALSAVAGRYAASGGTHGREAAFDVSVARDCLVVDLGMGGPPIEFLPISPETFFDRDIPTARLVFATDTAGRTMGFTASGFGPDAIRARKLP